MKRQLRFFSFLEPLELLCRGSGYRRAGHASRASTDTFNAIEQDLHDVFAIMGKCTRILGDPLVVVGRSQQIRCPGTVGVVARGFVGADLAVAVGILEEVRVVIATVANWIEIMLGSVILYGCQQLIVHGLNLTGDAFRDVAIAIVIGGVPGRVTERGWVGAAVAGCTLVGIDRQLVDVVALHAGV